MFIKLTCNIHTHINKNKNKNKNKENDDRKRTKNEQNKKTWGCVDPFDLESPQIQLA